MIDPQPPTPPDSSRRQWTRYTSSMSFGPISFGPVILGLILILLWWGAVTWFAIPPYLFPPPEAVLAALLNDPQGFAAAALLTFGMALGAFALAVSAAFSLAMLFALFPALHRLLFPYVIILQVTPIIALAPLLLILIGYDHARLAIIILAALTAFFPMLINSHDGLKQVDPGLYDVFRLYRARPQHMMLWLRLPSALPLMLSGLRVAGNLALIGAVVAELIAGSGAAQGLAWRIIEAGRRLEINVMIASLLILAGLGLTINIILASAEKHLKAYRGL